jgi:thiol-disulfide isomerase/thioredoxin
MNRNILILGALLVGCASADRVQQIEEKLETISPSADGELSKKVAQLEKDVAELKKGGGAAAKPSVNTEKEKKAAEIYREVQASIKSGDMGKAKAKLAEMEKNYGDTRLWKRAQRTKKEIEIIGGDAPKEYTGVEWMQGTSDLGSGTTLVVFWEIWCPHCKREVPSLEARHNKYKSKGLNIVGLTKLSRNKSKEEVMKFVTDSKVTYPIGKEDGALSKAFAVSGIPAAAVVKDGKIVWRGHPGSLDDGTLEGFLN